MDEQIRNLRRKKEGLSGLEGLLEILSLEMTKIVKAGTHLKVWRK